MGGPKENFDAAWSTIVKSAVTVSSAPQMQAPDTKGDWQITGGYALFRLLPGAYATLLVKRIQAAPERLRTPP